MFAWLAENLGTILVLTVLIAAVTLIILSMKKEKKQGKPSCGGSSSCCGNCAMCGACRQKAQADKA